MLFFKLRSTQGMTITEPKPHSAKEELICAFPVKK